MSDASRHHGTRAERLVRLYPKEWRARYGDEFTELLAAEITEQPRSAGRTVDIAVGAFMAHLAAVGLSGTPVDPTGQTRRSLATFGCALVVFLTFAVSIWSQLIIAWRWSVPSTTATRTGIVLMTVAVIVCVTAAVVGTIPVAWRAMVATARRQAPGLLRPVLLFLLGTALLAAGGLHFRTGWAGAGNHPWAHQSAGSGGAAAFMWAATLTVSAYWAHPATLLSLPLSEVAWMVISPVALVVAVTGAARTMRKLELSPGSVRFIAHAALVVLGGWGLFLFGTLTWLIDGGAGPADLFRAGTVDLIGLTVMCATMVVAVRSVHRATRSSRLTAS
jgi:hypothetical protein